MDLLWRNGGYHGAVSCRAAGGGEVIYLGATVSCGRTRHAAGCWCPASWTGWRSEVFARGAGLVTGPLCVAGLRYGPAGRQRSLGAEAAHASQTHRSAGSEVTDGSISRAPCSVGRQDDMSPTLGSTGIVQKLAPHPPPAGRTRSYPLLFRPAHLFTTNLHRLLRNSPTYSLLLISARIMVPSNLLSAGCPLSTVYHQPLAHASTVPPISPRKSVFCRDRLPPTHC